MPETPDVIIAEVTVRAPGKAATMTDAERDQMIAELRDDAMRVFVRTMRTGVGNKVAVDLAKFILFEASKIGSVEVEPELTPAEQELHNVLMFARS